MTESGQVFSINCSAGGVPKLPGPEAVVTIYGLFGDDQANKVHHGGPTGPSAFRDDQRFIRMLQKHHPGWSRVYARVLKEGMIRTGDAVALTPPGVEVKGWVESLLS